MAFKDAETRRQCAREWIRRKRASSPERREYDRQWNNSEAHREAQRNYRASGRERLASRKYAAKPGNKTYKSLYMRSRRAAARIQKARDLCRVIS